VSASRSLPHRTSLAAFAVLLVALLTAAGCGGGEPAPEEAAAGRAGETGIAGSVTIYSGRNESLVRPLLERFLADTNVEVQVRYGETAELAATLLEEGDATPADVFISQDAAALGALADRGLFLPLPEDVLARVPRNMADPEGLWVGLSGRARTVVYNSERVQPEDLPKDLEEVADPRFRGRWGVAPLNGSFQAHMTVYRALNGPEALDELLASMAANEPQRYPKNSAIVEAVIAGEVDWGLVNHYYLWRALSEAPDAPAANFYMPAGDASGFVNLAGAGVLSDNPAALELVRYLLADDAQRYFAQETFEYPLVEGIEPAVELLPLRELGTPEIDFREVSAQLEATLEAINQSGLVR
jgi:iron(III) transport system substrate-binding protein